MRWSQNGMMHEFRVLDTLECIYLQTGRAE
jgi:hypothetical protein